MEVAILRVMNRDLSTQCNVPVISLESGPWRAEVFDPRPDPLALGTRYVHGGYVRALWHADRLLTGRACANWDPYVGEGIPDVFEYPLAADSAAPGGEYLKIGAARLRNPSPDQPQPVATGVLWRLTDQTPASVTMHCSDEVTGQRRGRFAYDLTRHVHLDEAGLVCQTSLRLSVPWNHPVCWFSHPFFGQTTGEATGFELPAGSDVTGPLSRSADGLWRLPPGGGLANVTGFWGRNIRQLRCLLDPAVGGGVITLDIDKPLDHLVLYASPSAASPEPQLSRTWKDGEEATWSLHYRFIP